MTLRPIKDAGTALALASRLGASAAKASNYGLADAAAARQQAEVAAVADARRRATAVAAAAGGTLGPLISVVDRSIGNRDEEMMQAAVPFVPPPEVMVTLPPIVVSLNPEPIVTSAAMVVTYAIAP